jgi:hypothetical protein
MDRLQKNLKQTSEESPQTGSEPAFDRPMEKPRHAGAAAEAFQTGTASATKLNAIMIDWQALDLNLKRSFRNCPAICLRALDSRSDSFFRCGGERIETADSLRLVGSSL